MATPDTVSGPAGDVGAVTVVHNAEEAGAVRGDVDPADLLGAVANLCIPPPGSHDNLRAHRMVALLIDGLRHLPA